MLIHPLHAVKVGCSRALRGARWLTAAAPLLLGSCIGPAPVVVLWTDRAELAAYVETFNASDLPVKIELIYREQPAVDLLRGAPPPDLVFGAWLTSPELSRTLTPLDQLFRNEVIDSAAFYPELLARGRHEDRQLSLPFSFNLPVLVFTPPALPADVDQFVLTIDDIRALGADYVAGTADRLTRIGFSPLWDVDFIYYAAQLRGADFAGSADGGLLLDEASLADTVELVRDWIEQSHGGAVRDQRFVDTYFHEPLYQLVLEGRIRMYFADAVEFFSIPDAKRSQLDFRWLADDGVIPVMEDYRSFAIPVGAANPAGARLFLGWVFDPQVQGQLFETATFKRLRVFGLTGGFSTLRQVTERIIPRYHEFLIGHLPDARLLEVPAAMLANWHEVHEQVVRPWLRAAVSADGTATGPTATGGLGAAVRRWSREVRLQ